MEPEESRPRPPRPAAGRRPDPEVLAALAAYAAPSPRGRRPRAAGRTRPARPAARRGAGDRITGGAAAAPAAGRRGRHVHRRGVAPLLRVYLLGRGHRPAVARGRVRPARHGAGRPRFGAGPFRPDVTLCCCTTGVTAAGWDPTRPELRETGATGSRSLKGRCRGFASRAPSTVLLHTVPLSPIELRTSSATGAGRLGRIWRELDGGLLELPERHGAVHVAGPGDAAHRPSRRPAGRAAVPVRQHGMVGVAWRTGTPGRRPRSAGPPPGCPRRYSYSTWTTRCGAGSLGDDGPDGIQLGGLYPGNAYVELQRRARALRRQGVLLAVGEQERTASTVDQVLARTPGDGAAVRRLRGAAVDWGPRTATCARIAESLDLGLDSFVFADDSRFECDLVRHS